MEKCKAPRSCACEACRIFDKASILEGAIGHMVKDLESVLDNHPEHHVMIESHLNCINSQIEALKKIISNAS